MAVCDKDCFHCPFDDCINDEMDHADYVESAARDKALFMTREKKKAAARHKAWREANREKVAAWNKAWYEANREKVSDAHRALKDARVRLGWSQAVAARWLGVSQSTWSNYENGANCPKIEQITKRLEEMA